MTKKILWLSLVLLLAVTVVAGCGNKDNSAEEGEVEQEQIDLTGADTYQVKVADSSLTWSGQMNLVDKKHYGTVVIKEGKLMVRDGQVLAGDFILDMTTIDNQDLTGEGKTKLEDHLKSDDFFSTKMYPEAKLNIIKAEYVVAETNDEIEEDTVDADKEEIVEANTELPADYMLTADLTIKDKTNTITFPAHIVLVQEDQTNILTATAEFTIDRTLWDIQYGSGSFFDDLGDQVIDDNIVFNIELTAENIIDQEEITNDENNLDTAEMIEADSANEDEIIE